MRLRNLLLTSTALLALGSTSSTAGPDGPVVVGGTAAVTGAGTGSVVVNQSSSRAIINWNTFNIGAGETTTFVQPGTSSVALNRVTGGLGPSYIYGTLNANGQVFVVNRDGVLVGSTGVINTAGFLATTHDINNADFMAGRYNFNIPGRLDASIVNRGSITATSGGFAALVAPGVRNSGTITATLGTVALASGNSFTLDLYGDKLIQLAPSDAIAAKVIDVATGKPLTSLVSNTGKLSANGGRVELTAAAARAVVDSVINTSGVIEANTVGTREGRIVLGAATATAKPSGAPTQTVKVSGTLSAAGKDKGSKGGSIVVTGENIAVTNARIDVSGDAGGGKVMLGGDWAGGNPTLGLMNNQSAALETYQIATASTLNIDATTTIDASAKSEGNGGKVVLWSNNQTTFAGTIFARGGESAGNGGFAEVSSKGQLGFTGTVDTRAPNGTAGTLLLDPANITISLGADTGGFAPTANNSVINVATLQNALAGNNVIVTTGAGGSQSGNITVATALNWSQATTLTLQANNNIAINAAITATNGGLTLNAGNTITAPAAVNVATFTLQNGAWTQVSSTLPAFSAQDFRLIGGSFLRASGGDGATSPYQIVDIYGLQGIGSSAGLLTKNYLLANNIDASGTANWNDGAGFSPIGNNGSSFSGVFDGRNHVINGLTISSANSGVGLFGVSHGTIKDVGVTNVDITALGTSQFVGAVAGINTGTITNTYSSGSIGNPANASIDFAIGAYGGLVGLNDSGGHVSQSHSTVAIDLTGPANGYLDAGGLVGQNKGSISEAYASGSISGTYSSVSRTYLGGLVGWNLGGSIARSYATGSVTGDGKHGRLGGLVGQSDGGSITQTFASGAIKKTGTDSIAGGLVAVSSATITSSYWDMGTTGLATSAGGTGLTTEQAKHQASYAGFDFTDTWFMIDGQTRPFLRSEYSTTINNAHQLQLIAMNLGASYTLGGNINLAAELANPSGMWGSQGFVPVGSINTPFTGQLDGQGQTIDGLKIAPTNYAINNIGLFAAIGSGGSVSNLNLTNANITANPNVSGPGQFIGVLAGSNGGTISNVHVINSKVNGKVFDDDDEPITGVIAGGLVGQNGMFGQSNQAGTIVNSSANVTVTVGDGCAGDCWGGFNIAGGLVGSNVAGSAINNSQAAGNVTGGAASFVGGLVGQNYASIIDSSASGTVAATATATKASSAVGGLVGFNTGLISGSSASGNASGVGSTINSFAAIVGGLAGLNNEGGQIVNSYATGNVTGANQVQLGGLVGGNFATITNSYATGAVSNTGSPESAGGTIGGLVGWNVATVTGSYATGAVGGIGNVTIGGLVGDNWGTISQSYATGAVSLALTSLTDATAGGLVGTNDGTVIDSYATGAVSSTGGQFVTLGGLVGNNDGNVSNSNATGNVSATGATFATLGGLAGVNFATITDSYATGAVSGSGDLIIGGLVGDNSGTIARSHATGAVSSTGGNFVSIGGLVGFNDGGTAESYATGNVTATGATVAYAGGLVGWNFNSITQSHATGNVVTDTTVAYAGGFAGFNAGAISLSYASGNVGGGPASVLGGFVGANTGTINQTYARGAVTGGDSSFIGGFVGINVGSLASESEQSGSITQSYALGPVTGGNNVVAAAFAALNLGTLNETYGAGLVTAGAGSTTGGLVASNSAGILPPIVVAASPNNASLQTNVESGTTTSATTITSILTEGNATNSFWDRQTTGQETSAGGVAMDTAVLAGGLPSGFDPAIWAHGSYPHLVNLGPQNTTPGPAVLPPLTPEPPPIESNQPLPPSQLLQVVSNNPIAPLPAPAELFTIQNLTQQLQQTQPVPQVASINNPTQLNVGAGRYFFLPPPEETRLVANEVVIQLPCNAPQQTLDAALSEMQLSVLNSQCLATTNVAVYRLQTPSGQALASVIRGLANHRIVASAQANYLYTLSQTPAALGPTPTIEQRGDAGQYVLEKLHLSDIHRRVRSNAVPIAVIDSEIDGAHPDLAGVTITRYDATGEVEQPHSHGTGMAGAIASNHRLLGTAPGAPLYAIRAFSTGKNASSESTTFNILRGLDYAVNNNVRIVNMSFAGPRDPTLERALKQAYDKGVILIAAAGNAGPKSPPLFPAADKHVIAVTATDIDDVLFTGATRGNHIAVSAPGVDILVPAPEGTYQMTTGTSVATAHVSGIVALMLERNPRLTPADVRRILTASAKRLGASDQFGAGLIDPTKALQLAAPRTVEAPALTIPSTIPARR